MSILNTQLKVSILIPTFNQEIYIKDAIASALSQTYPNIEVIVGDDASIDNTLEKVKKIGDTRLKYIRNSKNLGRTGNYRNLLYNHATGDYVVILDGDDYFTDRDFIAAAVNCIYGKMQVVMVIARATTKTLIGETVSRIPNLRECTGLHILSKLPRSEYIMMHMAVLYSRQHALETNFYKSDAISSDWESLYRLSLRGVVRYLNKNVGVWRQHEANETGTTDTFKLLSNLRVWESVYKEAIIFGMNKWRAKINCACCMANYASVSCIKLSRLDMEALVKFILLVVKEFRLSNLIFVIYPKYGARIVLSLLGYYQRAQL